MIIDRLKSLGNIKLNELSNVLQEYYCTNLSYINIKKLKDSIIPTQEI